MFQAGGETLCSVRYMNSLVLFEIRNNCLNSGRVPYCTNLHEGGGGMTNKS